MFRNNLLTTPLTSEIAENVLNGKIFGDTIRNDRTFIATLRALVDPRMKEGEFLELKFASTNYTKRQMDGSSLSTKRSVVQHTEGRTNTIVIHEFSSAVEENNKAWMDFIDEDFCEANPGFSKLEKVTAFFRKSFGVSCFINGETRCVQIFTTKLDTSRIHYLQCGIFAYLPWYFDPKEGVSELEMELISSLREKTSDKYIAALTKIAEKYDFRTKNIETQLKGFETIIEKRELTEIDNDIGRCNRDIDAWNQNISSKLRDLYDLQVRKLGLEQKIAEDSQESEIMDYFLCSKSVELIKAEGTQISFGVKQYLTLYDEEAVRRAVQNRRSFVYAYEGTLSKEQVARLVRAVFLDDEAKIKVCAAYRFDLFGSVRPIEHYNFGPEYAGFTPNTHIDQYGCMGNYTPIINELLRDHKYLEVIEQCIASCKSINFLDSTVMNRFISNMCDNFSDVRCIEMPDGTCLTALEAAEHLMEQEEKEDGEGN